MARVRFFYHEKGNHEETWYYLCKDEQGCAYVEHEFSAAPGSGESAVSAPSKMTIVEFLTDGQGTRQDNLLKLIGGIVPDGA